MQSDTVLFPLFAKRYQPAVPVANLPPLSLILVANLPSVHCADRGQKPKPKKMPQ
jgi:hypothetical protein